MDGEKTVTQNQEEAVPKESLEGEDGLYGWGFHRGPLIAAIILTAIFYIFVFLWVG
jgi:hypothetical protein